MYAQRLVVKNAIQHTSIYELTFAFTRGDIVTPDQGQTYMYVSNGHEVSAMDTHSARALGKWLVAMTDES